MAPPAAIDQRWERVPPPGVAFASGVLSAP
jgi:hypothetical protein